MNPLAIIKTILALVPLAEAAGNAVKRIVKGKPERDSKKRKRALEDAKRDADANDR
jgi:hypothetical protein